MSPGQLEQIKAFFPKRKTFKKSKTTNFSQTNSTFKDVQKLSWISHCLASSTEDFIGWPFVWPCVFQVDQLPSASWPLITFLRGGTFAMEMSGRKPRYSPRLCMLTLSWRERNVWMVDNYQRTNVTCLQYLDIGSFYNPICCVSPVSLSIQAIL